MASVDLNERTAELLLARAAEEGVSLDEFVEKLLAKEELIGAPSPRITVEEFDRMLEEEVTYTPGLPADFSRADIYADHD